MEGRNNITINVAVAVSDETALRCMRILEMWLSENPHLEIFQVGNTLRTRERERLPFEEEDG